MAASKSLAILRKVDAVSLGLSLKFKVNFAVVQKTVYPITESSLKQKKIKNVCMLKFSLINL